MRKIILTFSLIVLSFTLYSNEVEVDRAVEESVTKDYDQDGVYSSYEKALRKAQGSIYVTLPEKRGYWYTILDRVKAEEEELIPDEQARIRRKWHLRRENEKTIIKLLLLAMGTMLYSAPTYEYKRPLREGARGKWSNLRQHLNSGQRLERELTKVDKQIDKKVEEIQEIEDLLFRIEQYKAANNIR